LVQSLPDPTFKECHRAGASVYLNCLSNFHAVPRLKTCHPTDSKGRHPPYSSVPAGAGQLECGGSGGLTAIGGAAVVPFV